jgi:spore coat polysaccharide biosynthesis predicted glycosyltransferase SpsG
VGVDPHCRRLCRRFGAASPPHRLDRPLNGLAGELAACDVAVVGGGVSLYEAGARGVAAVAVPVVVPQRPTVRGFVTAGAALGDASTAPDAERVARDVVRLLRQPALRTALAGQGRKLVDGRGAGRVAEAIRRLRRRQASKACSHERRDRVAAGLQACGESHESSHLRSRRHALRA